MYTIQGEWRALGKFEVLCIHSSHWTLIYMAARPMVIGVVYHIAGWKGCAHFERAVAHAQYVSAQAKKEEVKGIEVNQLFADQCLCLMLPAPSCS